jgi:hypothetical protein
MEDELRKVIKDGYRYIVYYDDMDDPMEGDFENEEAWWDYKKKFDNEELSSYFVAKEKRCSACNEWHHVDTLGGIHASDEDEALNSYIKEHL